MIEMITKDAIVIGGGPCGLSAAIEIQNKGLDVLIIEKENIVNSLYRYPTHQTFFSSSIKLSIGDIPFITAKEKPKRNDALVYYRQVAELKKLSINNYETVEDVEKQNDVFIVKTNLNNYSAKYVIIATGYYDNPNKLGITGEDLPKVSHYFKEAHPYFGKKVVVIGGKNSAVDAAIELFRAGASVTVIYRGSDYSPSVKPWILPGFDSLVRNGEIDMHFNSNVLEITPNTVVFERDGERLSIENDYVFAMIGYHPDHSFLGRIGIEVDEETGRPVYDESTMESNIKGIYIAGVIAAGNNTNEIFIENGRHHGELIAEHIAENN
ncbi:YpdA family putative bacillithiol disulfide reductase [Sporosarcina thermotolerans]|uniref:YpdA family putative bacillithiol disulfide reductase n=1 Tax=Sporosarcina thermotolerans TaxID=633404 RepID=A0AAW9A8X6_9BACL|nr:YpdA family putative bacillithiol disulfide reductase [Sporosarcina thermotolerans]MDW0115578.1 YpdA family putative bacillithiol disulfide reductase [Sporosarcina thermotolerans]